MRHTAQEGGFAGRHDIMVAAIVDAGVKTTAHHAIGHATGLFGYAKSVVALHGNRAVRGAYYQQARPISPAG